MIINSYVSSAGPLSNKVNLKVRNDWISNQPPIGELNEFQVEHLPQSSGGILVRVVVPKVWTKS